MRVSYSIRRPGLTVAAGVVAAVLTACGGDFEYKTSGDRIDGGNRAGIADWDGASTTSHENLMSIQEQYQAKVKAESGQK
ncbi:MAG: hypothetical protein F4Y02_06440 [Chloroflexi bacterium]|nr:hypothetical protein [Chloroflexota bacterium]